jgi:hypothetical protein
MSEKLTMEQMLTQAAGGTIEQAPVEQAPVEQENVEQEDVEQLDNEGNVAAAPVTETKPKTDTPKANPMKEVRDKYQTEKTARERLSTLINQFSKGDYNFKLKDFTTEDGLDYDSLQEAMEDADRKVKADSKGISPEIQAELERIEKEKIELQKQRLQVSMDRALTNMQLELGLRTADVNNFFKDAMSNKKNPYQWLAQGGSLLDLYNIVYADKIVERRIKEAVEKEKTAWEADSAKRKAPIANPAKQTQSTQTEYKEGLSMEELLERAATRNK